ncbi:metallophosphoesterase family protein [Haladaptatus salinisoli]|uniref:metallophosphoesterase family protein n=1 Tax=Haladaptatus salinisoli TaxID=2884876 RepID=UPI001D0A9A53|nr:metallophosphoesterase [Haladaptatus salinisoli]
MLVLGDAHADDPDNRRALFAAYRASDADVALQLGDLMYYDLPKPTWFVAGNNEDFDTIAALRNGLVSNSEVRNANLLASTAVDVDGVRVAGLSGNYAPTQYDRPRANLVAERRRHFTREDVERAMALQSVDVLLTHEAPHGLPVAEDYDVGCSHVDDLLSVLDPELCLVGHHHQHAEATLENTRVVSLAPTWERYYTLDPDSLSLTWFETPDG